MKSYYEEKSCEIVCVTPELARKWLEKNVENRSLSNRVVNQYAKDMKEGRWAFSNDTIDFDSNGNLVNGQHRLYAIIKSDTSQIMCVIRGVDPNMNMDRPRSRTAKDNLEIFSNIDSKLCNTNVIAMCNYILSRNNIENKSQYTLLDFMKKNENELVGYIENVGIGDKIKGSKHFTASVMAAFFMAYYNGVSPEELKNCRVALSTGRYVFNGYDTDRYWPMIPLDKRLRELIGRTREERNEMFLRTQHAIYCSVNNKQYKRLPYRLPDDTHYKMMYGKKVLK